MKTSLLAGRDLLPEDNDGAEPVPSVVNRAFARRYFGTESVLGRDFIRDDGVRHRIVGLAANAYYGDLRSGPELERLRGESQMPTDGIGFKMPITVAPITVGAGGAINIADHRERETCVTSEILPEAEARRHDRLVTTSDRRRSSPHSGQYL